MLKKIMEIKEEETLIGLFLKLFFRFKLVIITLFYRNCFASVGSRTLFEGGLNVHGGKNIKIGKNVYVGKDVELTAVDNGYIEIGDNCVISHNAEIRAVRSSITIGNNSVVNKFVTIKTGKLNSSNKAGIAIGEKVWIGQNSIIEGEVINIEDEVILAPFVHVLDNDHKRDMKDKKIHLSLAVNTMPVRLKRNCWIGSGAKILKGANIGECAIVGAGSVVTREVADFTTVAGVPAELLGSNV